MSKTQYVVRSKHKDGYRDSAPFETLSAAHRRCAEMSRFVPSEVVPRRVDDEAREITRDGAWALIGVALAIALFGGFVAVLLIWKPWGLV